MQMKKENSNSINKPGSTYQYVLQFQENIDKSKVNNLQKHRLR